MLVLVVEQHDLVGILLRAEVEYGLILAIVPKVIEQPPWGVHFGPVDLESCGRITTMYIKPETVTIPWVGHTGYDLIGIIPFGVLVSEYVQASVLVDFDATHHDPTCLVLL